MEKEHEESCQEERYSALEEENKRAEQERAKLAEALERVNEECSRLNQENAHLNNDLHEKSKQLDRLTIELEEAKHQADTLNSRYEELNSTHQSAMQSYQETYNALTIISQRADMLQSSRSWRYTAPIRALSRAVKRCIGKTARRLYHLLRRLRGKPENHPESVTLLEAASWPPRIENTVDRDGASSVSVHCKRIGVYTFYDGDGIVDEYVLYYLRALSPWVDRLLVVCNGQLRTEGEAALRGLGCEILMRENKGFDAWGVRAAIEKIGFEELSQYDEAVIANNTIFGPVSGFDEIFNTMSSRKVDFWGISMHPGTHDANPFDCNPYGYMPEHIQSYFYCVRNRMLTGEAFRRFWEELPELPNYDTAVGLYETVMTHFFSDAGYKWDCIMDMDKYLALTDNPLITMPMESIRDWNCPFFKRRAFFQDYTYFSAHTGFQSAFLLMHYLKEGTNYPTEMVWKNLIRTCHMCDLAQNIHLSKIFDKEDNFSPANNIAPKAALFMHIYDHTMAPELAAYAANLPPEVDIYISTVSEEKKNAILQVFQKLPNALEIRVLPNRGRDVSALLTSFRDVVMNYEVACVTHDKKTEFLEPMTMGEGFAYMGYENILGSRAFVDQVLCEFAEDPFLGLLCAPDPSHGELAAHIGMEWLGNYPNTKKLAQEIGLHVPMDEEHPPVASYGSSFWFRTAAMAPLFAKKWTYNDFPEEPLDAKDGTIMHAIERIWPYVAQHSGYYSAVVMTSNYAALEIGNLAYYTHEYCHAAWETGRVWHFTFVDISGICNAHLMQNSPPPMETIDAGESGVARRLREKLKTWAEL